MTSLLSKDHVAYVAGSSRGIGLAIAGALLRGGARVAITGRDPIALEAAAKGLAAEHGTDAVMALKGDAGDVAIAQQHADAVIERWGRVDSVVVNAGTGSLKPGWEMDASDWKQAFEANLWPATSVMEVFLPRLVEAKQGVVVFISSIVGLEATAAPLAYSAAKAALTNYSKNLALQVGPHGVRVNCVAPGHILFPGGSWEKKLQQRDAAFRESIERDVALRRFGTPEDVAEAVAFLVSDRASYITGACLVCDGGLTRSI